VTSNGETGFSDGVPEVSTPRPRLTADERRLQILNTAAEVFAANGLESARTREIAKACGVNEALLYKHFPSKKDLFCEAITLLFERSVDSWRPITAAEPDGFSAVRTLVRTQIETLARHPFYGSNMVHAVASSTQEERLKTIINRWFQLSHDFIVSLVERGIRDGSIRSDLDPNAVAFILRAVVWGAIVFDLVGFDETEIRVEMPVIADGLLYSILRNPER
jgi:AcrR family transcriptional regulator